VSPVEDYLDTEKHSEQRHECRDGVVVAMAGASKDHERVAMNLAASLHAHLKGKPCEVFKSDMRLNMKIHGRVFYLYPDLMVAGDPDERDPHSIQSPKLLIEVLSEDENRDWIEKFLMHQRIPSLEEYAVVSQRAEFPEVSVFRKSEGWDPGHVHTSGAVTFASVGLTIRVEDLYAG
jgi:Uma2 family endonuclease